jgi:hypothetical protein
MGGAFEAQRVISLAIYHFVMLLFVMGHLLILD